MATIQTEQELASWRRPLLLGLCLVIVVVVLGVWVWSGPRAHVEVPGSDATPEQVVLAYAAAVNARDFDTVNAIDARDGETPGRFSRTRRLDNVEIKSVTRSGDQVHVTFYADFSGWDISLPMGATCGATYCSAEKLAAGKLSTPELSRRWRSARMSAAVGAYNRPSA